MNDISDVDKHLEVASTPGILGRAIRMITCVNLVPYVLLLLDLVM